MQHNVKVIEMRTEEGEGTNSNTYTSNVCVCVCEVMEQGGHMMDQSSEVSLSHR